MKEGLANLNIFVAANGRLKLYDMFDELDNSDFMVTWL